ncbi:MAG: universal stress protein [Mucilaginibacter sp.]|nr:universal stress protein [Mucilaginibacter sp.]
MKKIVIPIDYAGMSPGVIAYLTGFSRDFPVSEIVLIKSFHQSSIIEKTFTIPGIVGTAVEEPFLDWEIEETTLKAVAEKMIRALPITIQISARMVKGTLIEVVEAALETEKPDLLIIINDAKSADSDRLVAGSIVPIAQMSAAPVLLLPFTVVYRPVERVLIPTTFQNLMRLENFKKLCQSHVWLNAKIFILNLDPDDHHLHHDRENSALLASYLDGYHFQIVYSKGKDVAAEILHFAAEIEAQVIFALPGQHSSWHTLLHGSTTRRFALESNYPVLLLK